MIRPRSQNFIYFTALLVAFSYNANVNASILPSQRASPHTRSSRFDQEESIINRNGDLERLSQASRSSVTVQILNGDQKGSGILIRDNSSRPWIVTNRHVVANSSHVCIRLQNGSLIPGRVLKAKRRDFDLAFVSTSQEVRPLPYAVTASHFDSMSINPIVATGYSAETDSYLETTGVTVPILRGRVLQSGYSVTYSSQIEKGMSGGGIFSDTGQVIGINALHSDPLWPGDWYDANGSKLNEGLQRRLDSVSIGISITTILSELDDAIMHAAERDTTGFSCKSQKKRSDGILVR